METEYRFLNQLEQDLRDAAERESALEAAPLSRRRTSGRGPKGGNGRTASWGTIAAALAILLVIAGAIGGLAQLGGNGDYQSVAIDGGGATAGTAAEPESRDRDLNQVAQPTSVPAGISDTTQPWSAVREHAAQYQVNTGGGGGQAPAQDLSKIVRDGSITLVVPADGFGDAFDQATAIAEGAGGFVLSSSISQENQGTLTLRVPSKKLDGAVVKLRSLGRLAELSLSGRDVTADYIDLKARLQVLQTQRELIVKLLNESTSVGGQLSLSNRFADVQTQIEQIQGSLNVLNDKVDLATLKVTLREEGVAETPDETDDISNPSLGSAWHRAKQGFFGVIAAVVVGLGYLIPVLVLAGLVFLIWRAVNRRRAAS